MATFLAGPPARSRFRAAGIAAEAGFADVTHFHRVFRQAYGCTPAGLRRESGAGRGDPRRHGPVPLPRFDCGRGGQSRR